MTELRCGNCNKKLLTYDNTSFRRYKSPLKKCKKCGNLYADPRCHEIAIEGIPKDTFSVFSYLLLMAFGLFLVYRGIHISGLRQLNASPDMQWVMPAFLMIAGGICVAGGIVEVIGIVTGRKAKRFDRLRMESEARLCDKEYAHTLKDLGYEVPEKYL